MINEFEFLDYWCSYFKNKGYDISLVNGEVQISHSNFNGLLYRYGKELFYKTFNVNYKSECVALSIKK
jgi:hypothetical protein